MEMFTWFKFGKKYNICDFVEFDTFNILKLNCFNEYVCEKRSLLIKKKEIVFAVVSRHRAKNS